MNKYCYLIIWIICVSISCSNEVEIQEISINEFQQFLQNDLAPSALVVGDYHQIKGIQKSKEFRTVKRQMREYHFYYTDISLQENRGLYYAFQFSSLPAILFFDKEGDVDCIYSFRENVSEGTYLFDDYSFQKELLDCSILLNRHEYKSIQEHLSNQNNTLFSFYGNYLLTLSFENRPDSCDYYLARALESYQKEPSQDLFPLYFDLVNRFQPKATLSFDSEYVDLGEMNTNDTKEAVITVFNHGDTPLLFQSIAVSCSCLSIKAPSVIKPHDNKPIHLFYTSGDTPGEIKQTVTIITNTAHPVYTISIKGRIL